MRSLPQRLRPLVLTVVVLLVLLLLARATIHILHSHGFGLPMIVHPLKSKSRWTAYGGTWTFSDSVIENASDERGAKLVMGSPYWQNYSVDADLELEGEGGDAGLLLHVQEPDEGVDAFRGVYVGLRLEDNALIAGQADYGWTELRPQSVNVRLQPFTWYHLHVAEQECRLFSIASTMDGQRIASLDAELPDCNPRGQVGLRSYRAGGSWKNIHVQVLEPGKEQAR